MSETKQKCCGLFSETLKEFSAANIALQAEDYYELACATERAVLPDRSPHRFLVPPVVVGNFILEYPTFAAVHWWETFGWKWCAGDMALATLAKAYICVYGRSKKRIDVLWGSASCERALLAFRLKLGVSCTTNELAEAVGILLNESKQNSPDGSNDDNDDAFVFPWRFSASEYGDIVSLLCSVGHMNPVDALYIPINVAYETVFSIRDPMTGNPLVGEAAFDAFVEFRSVVAKIKEKRCSASASA